MEETLGTTREELAAHLLHYGTFADCNTLDREMWETLLLQERPVVLDAIEDSEKRIMNQMNIMKEPEADGGGARRGPAPDDKELGRRGDANVGGQVATREEVAATRNMNKNFTNKTWILGFDVLGSFASSWYGVLGTSS